MILMSFANGEEKSKKKKKCVQLFAVNLATELGNLNFLSLLPSRISVFGYDLLQFLVDVEITRPGYSSQPFTS